MTSAAFTLELNTLRDLHSAARTRAREAWAACVDLSMCRVWLPIASTRNALAEAIYYNAGYDASERYGTLEDFKEALDEDLATTWPVRDVHKGADCYVARPFFGASDDGTFFGHLRMHGVAPLRLEELKGLRVEPGVFGERLASGLSNEEAEVLLAFHRKGILALVNLLRKLETAMGYIKRVTASKEFAALDCEAKCHELVARIGTLAHLEAFGPTATFFGTDADKRNVLRELDVEAAITEFRG